MRSTTVYAITNMTCLRPKINYIESLRFAGHWDDGDFKSGRPGISLFEHEIYTGKEYYFDIRDADSNGEIQVPRGLIDPEAKGSLLAYGNESVTIFFDYKHTGDIYNRCFDRQSDRYKGYIIYLDNPCYYGTGCVGWITKIKFGKCT